MAREKKNRRIDKVDDARKGRGDACVQKGMRTKSVSVERRKNGAALVARTRGSINFQIDIPPKSCYR